MAQNRIGGTVYTTVNGERVAAKGEFTANQGLPKKNGVAGVDGVHGYTEEHRVPYIEGAITAYRGMDLEKLMSVDGATVVCEYATRTAVLYEAWWAGEGDVKSGESEVEGRWEGKRLEWLD